MASATTWACISKRARPRAAWAIPTATMAGKLLAEAVSGTAERFDVMANVPTIGFPGGTLLRWPGLVAGMLYYGLMDKL